ncbi:hypothetical protein Curi_c12070 [Gottschalkia acidurici 9a]|uniref:Uncharacterized protein n=1 Tax=Gottschalkia acidurici (strain ATCC 7906 / DSM 604 / BCRC 14475 / CIP 104303 / KCTC 5404 / NCIMB 10678 / 9a) TaxID=1128398 RepID=K0AY97_GOTA9|nr:hypothetical protein [Gottschalkia acidurici]AFS78219.1 hypothetical protein Curi_c12070 [Gottschalkia acidurici 9a]
MNKQKFKVIMGNEDNNNYKKYKFIKAEVTNTRLMGVIGLVIYWELEDGGKYCQLFHLDAEEYGIDDYESMINEEDEDINKRKLMMMGGLGGEFISISEKEARYLVCEFANRNNKFSTYIPSPEEYEFILNVKVELEQSEISTLWNKICEKITSVNQIINYFIMRSVGKDYEASRYLSLKDIDYNPVKNASILLKNVISETNGDDIESYTTESLIDFEDKHKIVISKIRVQDTELGLKIVDAEIKEVMKISRIEAGFKLNKKEYILVYDIKDRERIIGAFDLLKPHAMKGYFEDGYLYTEFNLDNKHVSNRVYYLNDDVYGVYYITEGNELIVATYDYRILEEIEDYFLEDRFKDILALKEKVEMNQSILYEFINSDCDTFRDFLK